MQLITLPMPPTLNAYYKCNGRAKYMDAKAKAYRAEVISIVKANNWDYQANVRLKVMIVLNFENRRSNDLDNRMKGLLDALTHANVWDDDELIDDLHVMRGVITSPATVMINVQAMEDVADD